MYYAICKCIRNSKNKESERNELSGGTKLKLSEAHKNLLKIMKYSVHQELLYGVESALHPVLISLRCFYPGGSTPIIMAFDLVTNQSKASLWATLWEWRTEMELRSQHLIYSIMTLSILYAPRLPPAPSGLPFLSDPLLCYFWLHYSTFLWRSQMSQQNNSIIYFCFSHNGFKLIYRFRKEFFMSRKYTCIFSRAFLKTFFGE